MDIIKKLTDVLTERKNADPSTSYAAKLYSKGIDNVLKKIGEEFTEYVIAVKEKEKNHVVYEAADLIFHLYVSLIHEGILPMEVYQELERRFGVSGIEEKNTRTHK